MLERLTIDFGVEMSTYCPLLCLYFIGLPAERNEPERRSCASEKTGRWRWTERRQTNDLRRKTAQKSVSPAEDPTWRLLFQSKDAERRWLQQINRLRVRLDSLKYPRRLKTLSFRESLIHPGIGLPFARVCLASNRDKEERHRPRFWWFAISSLAHFWTRTKKYDECMVWSDHEWTFKCRASSFSRREFPQKKVFLLNRYRKDWINTEKSAEWGRFTGALIYMFDGYILSCFRLWSNRAGLLLGVWFHQRRRPSKNRSFETAMLFSGLIYDKRGRTKAASVARTQDVVNHWFPSGRCSGCISINFYLESFN